MFHFFFRLHLIVLVTISASALLGKTHDPVFKWKFYGFSALLDRGAVRANSALFHCCGYSWYAS
jgi:hypothetical protein